MDEQEYYRRRAEQQLKMAQSATHAGVSTVHRQLADLYLDHRTNLRPVRPIIAA